MPVTNVTSGWSSGNLVFYEEAVGRSVTGDVLTVGTGAVTVGGTSQDVDFAWYGTGSVSFILDAGDSSMTLAGCNVAIDGDIVQSADAYVANGYGLIVGHTSQETISDGGGSTDVVPEAQILGTAQPDSTLMVAQFNATNASGPMIALVKSGDAALDGTHAAVADNEYIGRIVGFGDDGTDLETAVAEIRFVVDDSGGPGTGAIGGSLEFFTTADGGSTLTKALTIDTAQHATFVGDIVVDATTASTSSTTGSIQTDGGLGVAGALYVAGAVVFNDASADVDFRVESDNLAYALAVDGAKDCVVVGDNTDVSDVDVRLRVGNVAKTLATGQSASLLHVAPTGSTTEFTSGTHAYIATAYFAEPNITHAASGTITTAATVYIADAPTEGDTDNAALYVASGATILQGAVVVNEASADIDFRVETDNLAYAIYADGAKDCIVIGDNTDKSDVDVRLYVGNVAKTLATGQSASILHVAPTAPTTEFTSGTHGYIATAYFKEPNITHAGGGTITTAATVYIADAPTEANTNNAALFVASGATILLGDLTLGADDTGIDVIFYGENAGRYVWWDPNGDTDGAWYFGADTEGIMVNLYGDTTGCGVFWDPSGDTNGTLTIGGSGGSKGNDVIMYGNGNGSSLAWDQSADMLIDTCAVLGNDARAVRFLITCATPAMSDGYGAFETDLTVTGTATGGVYATSTWINLGGSSTVNGYMFCHNDGVWDGGTTMTALYVAWAKFQFLPASNPNWVSWFEGNFSGANSEIDSIFNCNDVALAMGYAAGESGQGVTGTIPLFSSAHGTIFYVDVHTASA